MHIHHWEIRLGVLFYDLFQDFKSFLVIVLGVCSYRHITPLVPILVSADLLCTFNVVLFNIFTIDRWYSLFVIQRTWWYLHSILLVRLVETPPQWSNLLKISVTEIVSMRLPCSRWHFPVTERVSMRVHTLAAETCLQPKEHENAMTTRIFENIK